MHDRLWGHHYTQDPKKWVGTSIPDLGEPMHGFCLLEASTSLPGKRVHISMPRQNGGEGRLGTGRIGNPINWLPGALGTSSPNRGCTCSKSGPKPLGLRWGRGKAAGPGAVLLPGQFSETCVLLWSEAFSNFVRHSASLWGSAGLAGRLSKPVSACTTLRSVFATPGSAGHCCL